MVANAKKDELSLTPMLNAYPDSLGWKAAVKMLSVRFIFSPVFSTQISTAAFRL